jgi:hypothetical protein
MLNAERGPSASAGDTPAPHITAHMGGRRPIARVRPMPPSEKINDRANLARLDSP